MTKEQIAEILLGIKAVALSPSEPYTFTSGIKSPIYTDNRLLMSHVEERRQIVDAFEELLKAKGESFDVIAGTATAGIPHAAWLAEKENAPMVYARSSKKVHGKKNKIEGLLKKGQKALVVEDLVSTGGSCLDTVRALREAGAVVDTVAAIFTYEMKKAKDSFAREKVKLFELTDFSTLIDVAVERKYIKADEAEKAKEWNKDPEGWGKKYGFY